MRLDYLVENAPRDTESRWDLSNHSHPLGQVARAAHLPALSLFLTGLNRDQVIALRLRWLLRALPVAGLVLISYLYLG